MEAVGNGQFGLITGASGRRIMQLGARCIGRSEIKKARLREARGLDPNRAAARFRLSS